MGRHTTPGIDAPVRRDDLLGWGAFSTLAAAVLVGVVAGWFEVVGVVVLGGLTTAALWFARSYRAAALARGRHASDTPWSPSDLLELKDSPAAQPAPDGREPGRRRSAGGTGDRAAEGGRRGAAGKARTVPAAAGNVPEVTDVSQVTDACDVPDASGMPAAAESAGGLGNPAGGAAGRRNRQAAGPRSAAAGDPLAWLPRPANASAGPDGAEVRDVPAGSDAAPDGLLGDAGTQPARTASVTAAGTVTGTTTAAAAGAPLQRLRRRASPTVPGPAPGKGAAAGQATGLPAGLPTGVPAEGEPAGHPPDAHAAPGDVQAPDTPSAPGPGSTAPAHAGPLPAAPGSESRRARRAVESTGGPTRPVLPVAPFEMAPGRAVPAPSRSPEPMAALSALPGVTPGDAPIAAALGADPLARPISLDLLAAEPTVLDPALDPLWPAPPASPSGAPSGAASGAATVAAAGAATVASSAASPAVPPAVPPALSPAPAAVVAAASAHGPAPATPADRDEAAAAIDPLWARRARRPERPGRSADRPAALRRQPGPLTPYSGHAPLAAPAAPGTRASVHAAANGRAAGNRRAATPSEPHVVVVPEPDVPDVLMLPESDVVPTATGEAPGDAPDGGPSWTGSDGLPACRPAPGTLSLDELLVLHTRRPLSRRPGSSEQASGPTNRPLE